MPNISIWRQNILHYIFGYLTTHAWTIFEDMEVLSNFSSKTTFGIVFLKICQSIHVNMEESIPSTSPELIKFKF